MCLRSLERKILSCTTLCIGTRDMMTDKDEMILVSKKVYGELFDDSMFLDCLLNAGVDNWDGYEYAKKAYQEMMGN